MYRTCVNTKFYDAEAPVGYDATKAGCYAQWGANFDSGNVGLQIGKNSAANGYDAVNAGPYSLSGDIFLRDIWADLALDGNCGTASVAEV